MNVHFSPEGGAGGRDRGRQKASGQPLPQLIQAVPADGDLELTVEFLPENRKDR